MAGMGIAANYFVRGMNLNKSSTLSECMQRNSNNYDLVRLFLAIAVVFGHAFALSRTDSYKEPVLALLKFNYIGDLAVYGFFLISGLFVTASYIDKASLPRFLIARFFRVFPGLFLCLLISAYVIGPIFSEWSLWSYLRNPEVSSYVLSGLSLHHLQWELPGLFAYNPMKSVNGSLWSIVGEVFCYFCLSVIGVTGLLKKHKFTFLICAALFLFVYFKYNKIYFFSNIAEFKIPFLFFISGSFLAVCKDRFPINFPLLCLMVVICLLTKVIGDTSFRMFFYLTFGYSLLYFGQTKLARNFPVSNDISYGIYLYGFIVQQTVESLLQLRNPWLNFTFSIPFVVGLAYMSWWVIERPMIKFAFDVNSFFSGKK